jgi:dTDP-L-rhamnose 4-epimerase
VRVGLTGGAGFIGVRLSGALLEAGHSVTILDNLHPQVHTTGKPPSDLPAEVSLEIGSVTSAADLDRWLGDHPPEVIVHLAAETGTGQSLSQASRHATVNVAGTAQLLDALVRIGHLPHQLLVASSRAVYGEGAWRDAQGLAHYARQRTAAQLEAGVWDPTTSATELVEPIPHSTASIEPRPTNVYAVTKLAQEQLMLVWAASFGVPISVLRLQNVYGPGQAVGNPYTGVLTFFATQLAKGETLDVYEDGNILRDFVYVDDVVLAFHMAIERPPGDSRRLDIGSGKAIALIDVADMMTRIAGGSSPVVSGRFRHGDVRAAFADIDEAARNLGWQPQVELQDGLSALMSTVTRRLG